MLSFQPPVEPSAAAEAATEPFKAGETIIEHVSNTSITDPIIHLPKVFGIDMSVTRASKSPASARSMSNAAAAVLWAVTR